MSGRLILVPTPIDDQRAFSNILVNKLHEAAREQAVFVVEEHKIARRKWLSNGLPRESIEKFICLNEHSGPEVEDSILKELRQGRDVFLISDCGLPAFCDPGQSLVDRCHRQNIKVTATGFDNSVALALALSGLEHSQFIFEGFLARDNRESELRRILRHQLTVILMDTPYRLNKLVGEIHKIGTQKEIFLGIDLNSENELIVRGKIGQVAEKLKDINKREFVMVLGADGKR